MELPLNRNVSEFNSLNSIFSQWDRPDSPGCAIGIIQEEELIYAKGFGSANLEHSVPITTETVFRIASVSKQFTAACIILLEEQGKLHLEDNIIKYFPEFPVIYNDIKIIHLINHTSGLRDYLWLFTFAGYSFRALDLVDERTFLEMMEHQKSLNFDPGSKFMYSNSGYVILSLLIKRITGLTLRQFAKKHIFDPLQMHNTHFYDNHRHVIKNRAKAYTKDKEGNFIIYETSNELVGDGAVFTTISDMMKWAKNFTTNRLGKKSSAFNEKLQEPGILNDGTKINYALGLRITIHKGLKEIYHAGMIAGFRSVFIMFPEEKLTLFCFANLATINPENICNKIVDILLKDKIQSSTQDQHGIKNLLTVSNQKFAVEEFIGIYRNVEKKQIYSISSDDGKLVSELYAVDPIYLHSKTVYNKIDNNMFHRGSGLLEANLHFVHNSTQRKDKFIAYEDNGEKLIFERIIIPEISNSQLQKYAGRYYSEELDTFYHIEVSENHLLMIIKRIEKIQLNYYFIGENEFTCNQAFIKFYENAKGIYKFELSTLRIPNPIVFLKYLD